MHVQEILWAHSHSVAGEPGNETETQLAGKLGSVIKS